LSLEVHLDLRGVALTFSDVDALTKFFAAVPSEYGIHAFISSLNP